MSMPYKMLRNIAEHKSWVRWSASGCLERLRLGRYGRCAGVVLAGRLQADGTWHEHPIHDHGGSYACEAVAKDKAMAEVAQHHERDLRETVHAVLDRMTTPQLLDVLAQTSILRANTTDREPHER